MKMVRTQLAFILAGTALVMPASAQTFNFFGQPGLIDLPSGEPLPDAQIGATYSIFDQSQRTSVTFQLLPRVRGALRVSTIEDVPGGPSRSDEGFDLTFQLLKEDGWVPGVALGFRDVLGDGPYGAEYIVATKTVAPGLKVTGGVGFGRLGSDGGVGNPFGRDVRPGPTVPAGRPQFDSYFAGDAAFFGGLEWQTPINGLSLKAEYSSDAYTAEVAGGFERNSPFNFGLTWSPNENVQVSAAYLYGSAVGVSLSFTGNPNAPLTQQDLGSGPAPVRTRASDAPRGTAWAANPDNQDALVTALQEAYEPEGIVIEQAKITGTEMDLYVSNTSIQREPKAVGRVARVLALAMPPSVEVFRITLVEDGLPIRTVQIRRSDMEAQVDRPDAALKSFETTEFLDAPFNLPGGTVWEREPENRFTWSFAPSIPLTLLDTDDGFRPDILLTASAHYQITSGLSISGEASRFLIGEDQITTSTSTSPLPRVRSDSDIYFSGRDVDLNRLTVDWLFKPAPALYGRVTAGVLERMFTGVSGEVLWAPVNSDFALGAEVNWVRQRAFDDVFELMDYEVVTGHGSLYWDTGYMGLEAQLDVGRYLAGDWGATASLARSFPNGWRMRGFVTRTDVSFEEFGEGSFAKGFEVTIPLRWTLPFESKSSASVSLLPSENDGGARLDIEGRLYERIRDLDRRSLEDGWSAFWQ